MTDDDAATAVCLECGERFTRAYRGLPSRGIRAATGSARRRHTGRRYCSDACKQIGYRRRRAFERTRAYHPTSLRKREKRTVTLSPPPALQATVTLAEIRKEIQCPPRPKKRGSPRFWRWCERLDGSGDLYCDTEITMEHVARIVRRDGLFHLAKPALPMTWETRAKAERGVRELLRAR